MAGRDDSHSTSQSIVLQSADRDAIIAQAVREYPNECCGVLIGRKGVVEQVRPTGNALASPVAFSVDPRELLDALLSAEARGLDVVGYYHSHTGSPAYPSPTDVKYAAGWPGAVHLIVSLADSTPSIRAFLIDVGSGADEDDEQEERARPDAVIRELEVILR